MGEFQDRSVAYRDTCFVCGAVLLGRGTKRKVQTPDGIRYACYGSHKGHVLSLEGAADLLAAVLKRDPLSVRTRLGLPEIARSRSNCRSKRGSKVLVKCPVCGVEKTRAGMIGHLRFKHGRDRFNEGDMPRPMGIGTLHKIIKEQNELISMLLEKNRDARR